MLATKMYILLYFHNFALNASRKEGFCLKKLSKVFINQILTPNQDVYVLGLVKAMDAVICKIQIEF